MCVNQIVDTIPKQSTYREKKEEIHGLVYAQTGDKNNKRKKTEEPFISFWMGLQFFVFVS